MIRSAVVEREIDIASIVAEARSAGAGAVSLFIGTVRDTSDGRQVTGLEYEAYQEMAETELAGILDDAARDFGITSLIAEHRTGTLNVGDVSVVIASAHAHRAAAMACTRFVIDEIKKRVPIWKREHFVDGTREWVDPSRVGVSAS